MAGSEDKTTQKILQLVTGSAEPLETKEIEEELKAKEKQPASFTRVKVLYRLNMLRGDGLIKGKPVGSGKGTWIWWPKEWEKGEKQ